MIKKLFLLFFLMTITGLVFSQDRQQKKWTLSGGYGLGNVWVYFLRHNSLIKDLPDYKISSYGPVTLTVEHFISPRISVGLTGAYSLVQGESQRFLLDEQISITSIMARGNYHFGKSKKLDPYAGVGLGYIRSVYRASLSLPGSVPGEFGYSAQLGASYLFLPKWAVFAEIGYVNGSLLQLGFSKIFHHCN